MIHIHKAITGMLHRQRKSGSGIKSAKQVLSRSLLSVLFVAGFNIGAAHAVVVGCPTCMHQTIISALQDPALVILAPREVIQLDPARSPYMEGNLNLGGHPLESTTPNVQGSVVIDGTGVAGPVLTASGVTISGLTIRGGNNLGAPGGGIRWNGGSLVLRNMIIEGNTAGSGGAVGTITGSSQLIIDNCIIRNNTATVGGGGVLGGLDNSGAISTLITNSMITNNTSGGTGNFGRGGGVFLPSQTNNTITNSTISNNHAIGMISGSGGGIFVAPTTTLTMTNMILQGNTAPDGTGVGAGGGIFISSNDVINISGGGISGNSAGRGGGIFISIGSKSDVNVFSSVSGNSVTQPVGNGGGVFCSSSSAPPVSLSGGISGNTPDDVAGCGTSVTPVLGTTRTAGDNQQSASSNDPVNTFTGELFKQFDPDINLGGPMPLLFARYHASGFKQTGIIANLGANWRHNFDWKLSMIGTSVNIVNDQGRTIQFVQNGLAWDLVGKTDIVYQLVENTGIFTLLDPRSQLSYVFNSFGQLTGISDGHGNMHTLTYASGLLTQVSDGLGRVLNFTYDASNHLINMDDGQGRTVGFAYTLNDLTSVTDVLGNITTYAYDPTGGRSALISSVRPAGNTPFTQVFGGGSNGDKVRFQTNANGDTFNFAYTASNTTITDPLANTRVHTNTATGELVNNQDQAGQSIAIGSDATGRRNSITDRLGDVTTMTYHAPSGKLASVTHADATTESFTYTPRVIVGNTGFDMTGVTNADGTTISLVHDAFGNVTSRTDQLGNTSTATYNGNGQILTATNKLLGVTTNTYNADATLASTMDPAANTTTFGYDFLKRPILITHADGTTRGMTFDPANHPLTTTNENGNTTTLTYDANGNVSTITDALTNTTTFAYDGNDRPISVTNALNGISSVTYHPLGGLETTTDANGNVVTFGYNTLGRLTSITDPLGNIRTRTYDAEAIIASTTDPLLNTTSFVSDKLGRITQTTSPLGNITKVSYDPVGRIATTTDLLNQVTTFGRDARGRITSIALPGGTISTGITRNALGEPTAITDPNGNVRSRTYDSSGRLTSATDPLGNIKATTYDTRNRPATIAFPGTLGSQTLTYDGVGNLAGVNYTDGTAFGFTYDANNRLTAANNGVGTPNNMTRAYDANGRISNSNGIAITRDAGGRITGMTFAPGKTVIYAYDANDRVTSVTDWTPAPNNVTTFTYDNANRLTSITRPNGVNQNNTWDNDSRLVGISEGAISSINLTRDAKGQITAATRTVPTMATASAITSSANTFDAASQVSGNTYDALGRQTMEGANTFTWDGASRLTGYTVGATTAVNVYDSLGYRTRRTVGAATSDFVWNGALGIASISIERRGGTDFRYFIHTPGGALLYSIDAATNARSFYHFDEMGNTIFITDDAGANIGSYAYTAFGQLIASTGGLDNPFTWQGQSGVMDEGNGLYYVRARFYDANTGRFISRDAKKSIAPRQVNPYQYALNNPLRFVDPSGTDVEFAENQVKLAESLVEFPGALKKPDQALAILIGARARLKVARALDDISESLDKALDKSIKRLASRLARRPERTARAEVKSGGFSLTFEDAAEFAFAFAAGVEKAREEAREARIKHLKDILDKARKAANSGGTRTRKTQKELEKKVQEAEKAFEEAGGIESIVPELAPIVVLD